MLISNEVIASAMTSKERKEFLALSREIKALEQSSSSFSAFRLGRLEANKKGLLRRIEWRIALGG